MKMIRASSPESVPIFLSCDVSISFHSDYTLLLGLLRRLKDWHNASITLFDQDLSPDTEFLQKFLSASVWFDKEKLEYQNSRDVLWRGKMSICDKIVSSRILGTISRHS